MKVYIIMIGYYDFMGDWVEKVHSVYLDDNDIEQEINNLKQEYQQCWYIEMPVKGRK